MSEPLVSIRGLKKSFHKDGAEVDRTEGDRSRRCGKANSSRSWVLQGRENAPSSTSSAPSTGPTGGEILYRGKNIGLFTGEEQCRFRNEKVGFVFQFYHLLQDFTVIENIMVPLWIKRARPAEAQAAAEEFLEIMGLSDRRDHKPGELSGGEQQRVAIARALINRPELILADEPTGNLDRKTGREVLGYILEIRKKLGAALVLVTHDPEIGAAGDRRLNMVDGELFRLD